MVGDLAERDRRREAEQRELDAKSREQVGNTVRSVVLDITV